MLNLLQNEKLFNSQIYELFFSRFAFLLIRGFLIHFSKIFLLRRFSVKILQCTFPSLHTAKFIFLASSTCSRFFNLFVHLKFAFSFFIRNAKIFTFFMTFCAFGFSDFFSISVVTAKFIFCPAILQLFAFTCNYSFCFWLVLENTFLILWPSFDSLPIHFWPPFSRLFKVRTKLFSL